VEFTRSAKAEDYLGRLQEFMDEQVFPAEPEYAAYRRTVGRMTTPSLRWSSGSRPRRAREDSGTVPATRVRSEQR
jgi:hypothetical protein